MESGAWVQNAQANKIYSDIKSGNNLAATLTNDALSIKANQQKVAIGVGEFQWCTLLTSKRAAARRVAQRHHTRGRPGAGICHFQ